LDLSKKKIQMVTVRKVLTCTVFLLVFAGLAAPQPASVGEAAGKASGSVVVLPDKGTEEQRKIGKDLASGIGAEYVGDRGLSGNARTSRNLVLIGGPRINVITNRMKRANNLSGEPPQRGESKIQVLEGTFSGDKSVTVISGYATQEIRTAANRFERISSSDYEGPAQEQVLKFDAASYQAPEDSSNNSDSVRRDSTQEDGQENSTEQEPEERDTASSSSRQEGSDTDQQKQSGGSLINQILRLLGI
jgi:hypothetical protein